MLPSCEIYRAAGTKEYFSVTHYEYPRHDEFQRWSKIFGEHGSSKQSVVGTILKKYPTLNPQKYIGSHSLYRIVPAALYTPSERIFWHDAPPAFQYNE